MMKISSEIHLYRQRLKSPYNEIIQTSESVLKTVLHDKRNQFTLEKLFFLKQRNFQQKSNM